MKPPRANGVSRGPAIAAAVIGSLTLAVYAALLIAEGDSPLRARPLVFVVGIAIATAAAAAGAISSPSSNATHRTAALVVSAVLFGVAGLLGIFSIGLPLLVAAGLAAVAASR